MSANRKNVRIFRNKYESHFDSAYDIDSAIRCISNPDRVKQAQIREARRVWLKLRETLDPGSYSLFNKRPVILGVVCPSLSEKSSANTMRIVNDSYFSPLAFANHNTAFLCGGRYMLLNSDNLERIPTPVYCRMQGKEYFEYVSLK